MNMLSMSDSDQQLIGAISSKGLISRGPRTGFAQQLCYWHRVIKKYREIYNRERHFDGGVGATVAYALKKMIFGEHAETAEELGIQQRLLWEFVNSNNPTVPLRFQQNSALCGARLSAQKRRGAKQDSSSSQRTKRTRVATESTSLSTIQSEEIEIFSDDEQSAEHDDDDDSDYCSGYVYDCEGSDSDAEAATDTDTDSNASSDVQANNNVKGTDDSQSQIRITAMLHTSKQHFAIVCHGETSKKTIEAVESIGRTNTMSMTCEEMQNEDNVFVARSIPVANRLRNSGTHATLANGDVVDLAGTFEMESFVEVHEMRWDTIVRVRWVGFGPCDDTYELASSLRETSDGVDDMLEDCKAKLAEHGYPLLPFPRIYDGARSSDAVTGYTASRRAKLVTFVQDIFSGMQYLAKCLRPDGTLWLGETCNNRVEAGNRVIKFRDGKRVLGKRSSPGQFILKAHEDYRLNVRTTKHRSTYVVQSEPMQNLPGVAYGTMGRITTKACKLLTKQLEEASKYTCTQSCATCTNQTQHSWVVKRNAAPKCFTGPWSNLWRKRIVEMLDNELKCSCLFWNEWGIPCRHLIHVMLNELHTDIQSTDLLFRWSSGLLAGFRDHVEILWQQNGVFSSG
jgi:hypothetical protein